MKTIETKFAPDYDVAIIGGGVSGSLIAYNLSLYNIKICVIEKESDLAMGATGANSAIVHAGYDPKPGSLKAIYNIKGANMMQAVCKKLGVPYKNNGALVLAFSDDEHNSLINLYDRGLENKVKEIHLIEKERALNIEPNVSNEIISAIYLPSSSIVCPYELTFASAETAATNGARFLFEHEVLNIETSTLNETGNFNIKCSINSDDIQIKTISCKYIVNASGVNSGKISEMVGDLSHKIIPRKGEYVTLDKELEGFVKHTIFQAPSDKGKGVLVTSTVDGNILIGPNAVETEDPYDVKTTSKGIDEIKRSGHKSVPGLDFSKIIRSFAGIRATPDTGDFIIGQSKVVPGFFQCAGIESPGLTAAPAIAEKIRDDVLKEFGNNIDFKIGYIDSREPPLRFRELSYSQKEKLIKENRHFANVICRCENVTEAEIIEAIKRPVGAGSINGIKMRTRAGMGRCQGGFCLPKIVPVLAKELGVSMEKVNLSGTGSELLKGRKREY